MTHRTKPLVAITVGDYNGIGPEVVLKALNHPRVRSASRPILVGPQEVFAFYEDRLGIRFSGHPVVGVNAIDAKTASRIRIRPGQVAAGAGRIAADAIKGATRLVLAGQAHALVTAPVSKQAMHLAGERFPGQTEMVQHFSGSRHVAMMLVSETMRVGLATIHVPVREVAIMLTRRLLRERIRIVHDALRSDWRIRNPVVAVLGLNPHASEGGDIGTEDITIVAPVVRELQRAGLAVEGPFPADAFFGRYTKGMYDGIVAMYHDQGLIPLKMSSFGKGVNISVGMNIVRTSPDHGTAFDIAGKGVAEAGSMVEAIVLAAHVAHNRGISRRKIQDVR